MCFVNIKMELLPHKDMPLYYGGSYIILEISYIIYRLENGHQNILIANN